MDRAMDIIKYKIHEEAKFMIKHSGSEKNLTDNVILLFEKIHKFESDKTDLIELLKKIDDDVLLPYEHSYYKNRIKELIK
jgi:hypothetical protein